MLSRLLFCDDRRSEREAFLAAVAQLGGRVEVETASSLDGVESLLSGPRFDIVISDLDFSVVGGGKTDGLRILALCRETWPECDVLLLTASALSATPDLVLQAASQGVSREGWLPKTDGDPDATWGRVREAVQRRLDRLATLRQGRARSDELAEAVRRYSGVRLGSLSIERFRHDGRLVGCSRAMHRVFDEIEQVAPTPAPVLVTGETGTGKELVSQAIHALSGRQRLMVVNCGALTDELLASELFGHARGAFTGAESDSIGLLAQAADGTLFLDEIGELALPSQAKLLRVLQTGEFRPVGASASIRTSARFVAATNRDLDRMVAEGSFRQDLLDRLNVFRIHLPPLRERPADIPPAVVFHLRRLSAELRRTVSYVAEEAMWRLVAQRWGENTRELINQLTRVIVDVEEEPLVLGSDHLSEGGDVGVARSRSADWLWQEILRGELCCSLSELSREHGKPAALGVVRLAMLHFGGLPPDERARVLFGMSYRQWQQWAHYNGLTWERVRRAGPRG